MDRPTHPWPAEFAELLSDLHPNPDQPGCYAVEVDVSAEQLKGLALLEATARHRGVRLMQPGQSRALVGEMNPLVGLGAPADPAHHVARVRISFHDVAPE
jgi:hypothetical protein